MTEFRLLEPDEPHPVVVHRETGRSELFLTCDHAGRRIPRRLGDLGLPAGELERHIAWDIGALATSKLIAERLDATLVEQVYSRLVVDCNRAPTMPTFIAPLSEATEIPGNRDLDPHHAAARPRELHAPYRDRMVGLHEGRADPGRRVARILERLLKREDGLVIGDNEPYAISDTSDYGIPVHGEQRGIPHLEIEIRQDLIAGEAGQREWADRLAPLFEEILRHLPA